MKSRTPENTGTHQKPGSHSGNGGQQLHLCFLLFRAYPLFNRSSGQAFGGSEVELYNLARYFSRFSHVKVDFIVGDYGQKDVERYQNITVRKVRYMKEDQYKSFLHKVFRYLDFFRILLRQRGDIYLTKTASEHLGWMVLLIKFFKGKKVVFRLGSDKDAEFSFWKDTRRLYHLYRFGLRNSDLIYVQSEDQQKMLRTNCGVESRILKNVFPMIRGNAGAEKDYILWVSRCEPLKRPELFLKLAGMLPEEKFVMIMPHIQKPDTEQNAYDDRIADAARNAAKELGNLEYHSFVPFQKIQAYYNHAKLFINTSEYEGFPNSFIQACIGRTGILSFRVNPDGFLTENALGYCCEDDLEKAAGFIRNLDRQKIGELGAHAYEYVKRNHDIAKIGRIYLDDFSRLLEQERKKGVG